MSEVKGKVTLDDVRKWAGLKEGKTVPVSTLVKFRTENPDVQIVREILATDPNGTVNQYHPGSAKGIRIALAGAGVVIPEKGRLSTEMIRMFVRMFPDVDLSPDMQRQLDKAGPLIPKAADQLVDALTRIEYLETILRENGIVFSE